MTAREGAYATRHGSNQRFPKAKSVSIMMGEEHGEKGLHSARATCPVEISSSSIPASFPTRPHPSRSLPSCDGTKPNDNAGFKTAGGWYTVPDNKEWHTVRWQINDPQFVNYWGYTFSLVSDGDTFSKYYLQSVTVTKRGECRKSDGKPSRPSAMSARCDSPVAGESGCNPGHSATVR